jgi:hypothetical protein
MADTDPLIFNHHLDFPSSSHAARFQEAALREARGRKVRPGLPGGPLRKFKHYNFPGNLFLLHSKCNLRAKSPGRDNKTNTSSKVGRARQGVLGEKRQLVIQSINRNCHDDLVLC